MVQGVVESPDTALASYDYTELRDGFGLETFNLYTAIDNGGTDYIIGKETVITSYSIHYTKLYDNLFSFLKCFWSCNRYYCIY